MKIFITGATGYIGKKLLEKALTDGHYVQALVRKQAGVCDTHLQYFEGDITCLADVMKAMQGCEAVLHAAGYTKLWDNERSRFYSINVEGTRNILEAAQKNKVKKLVFTSSGAVLGPSVQSPVCEDDPRLTPFENDYEISKYCGEQLVREFVKKGLEAVIVSPTRVYGPGLNRDSNAVTNMIRSVLKSKTAFIPSVKNVRGNYAYIDDVTDGHFLALEKGVAGEKYSLGGENVDFEKLFTTIKAVAGSNIRLLTLPKAGFIAASYIHSFISKIARTHTQFTPEVVEKLYCDRAVSCQKAVAQLGYRITSFDEGIRKTIAFIKNEQNA